MVGRSIEVRHKLVLSLAETSLYFEANALREKYHGSTIGRHLLRWTVFPFNVFLLKWSKTKRRSMYQAPCDGREQMGELSLGGPKLAAK